MQSNHLRYIRSHIIPLYIRSGRQKSRISMILSIELLQSSGPGLHFLVDQLIRKGASCVPLPRKKFYDYLSCRALSEFPLNVPIILTGK